MNFNEDELELLEMISGLKPYDVMKIAVNQNGTRMSVTVENTAKQYKEFNIDRNGMQFILNSMPVNRRNSVLGIPA